MPTGLLTFDSPDCLVSSMGDLSFPNNEMSLLTFVLQVVIVTAALINAKKEDNIICLSNFLYALGLIFVFFLLGNAIFETVDGGKLNEKI